jgi:hypothetical protein
MEHTDTVGHEALSVPGIARGKVFLKINYNIRMLRSMRNLTGEGWTRKFCAQLLTVLTFMNKEMFIERKVC